MVEPEKFPSPNTTALLPKKYSRTEIVVIVVLLLFIGWSVFTMITNIFFRPRQMVPVNACTGNRLAMEQATQLWAMAHKKKPADTVTASDILEYLKGYELPRCPRGGSYLVSAAGKAPVCTVCSIDQNH